MESKKVIFFNKLSFAILLVSLFLSLFFFIPYSSVSLDAGKGFLLSVGITLSLFFWFISRLGDGKFLIPKDKLMVFVLAIPLVFLIASFFSSSLYISLFGTGFEGGTFGFMLVLCIAFFLSSIYFQSENRLWLFVKSLFIGGLVIGLFELLNIFVGFEKILPGILRGLTAGNLVGNWNNFALLFGLLVLLSVFTIELIKTNKKFRIIQYAVLVLGLIFLMIVNFPLVWLMVGIFSVIIFVYINSLHHSGVNIIQEENAKKKFPFASLVVVLISLMFLIGGNLANSLISRFVTLNNQDVRPSIVTTSQIAWKSFKHNPLFGSGPNTFINDWSLWQPKSINQTIFWNLDFSNGYSTLTTFAVTVGLLGFVAFILFLVVYVARSIQSIRIALKDTFSNYFIMTTLMISIYSWLSVILYNTNTLILTMAFVSSGMLIGILVHKQAIPVKDFSFLNDPRKSFFSILALLVLMVATLSLTYIYIEKFTSIVYFSRSLKAENTMESLSKAETNLLKATMLNKNDIYYRNLSQLYLNKINLLINKKDISEDVLKSNLQTLLDVSQQAATLAINQNPKQYLNYMNLGNIYAALVPLSIENSYESAMAAFDNAQQLAPNNPLIPLSKASLEVINKNNTKAREYITQALAIKPNYVDAIFLLAQIETNEGNLSEAIKQAEEAAKIAPNDTTVYFRLGLLRYNNNDFQGAVSAFEQSVMLNNNYLNARYFLGLSYKKVGRTNDALTQFNILAKVLPDNEDVKNAISSINEPASQANTQQSAQDNLKAPLPEKQ